MPPTAAPDTKLDPGDVFDVRVYGEDELSNTYRVSRDGAIDFPLVGRVAVEGLEPSEVASRLAKQLRDDQFLVNPQVSVFVKEYNSKRVSVVGAVAKPGTFPLTTGMTVVQAITLAGGFSNLADRNGTVLTRKTDDGTVRYRIRVDKVTSGQSPDFPLAAGDIIYVPERLF